MPSLENCSWSLPPDGEINPAQFSCGPKAFILICLFLFLLLCGGNGDAEQLAVGSLEEGRAL